MQQTPRASVLFQQVTAVQPFSLAQNRRRLVRHSNMFRFNAALLPPSPFTVLEMALCGHRSRRVFILLFCLAWECQSGWVTAILPTLRVWQLGRSSHGLALHASFRWAQASSVLCK